MLNAERNVGVALESDAGFAVGGRDHGKGGCGAIELFLLSATPCPPITTVASPPAVLKRPPLTLAASPLAIFRTPPLTAQNWPLAVLSLPPATVAPKLLIVFNSP